MQTSAVLPLCHEAPVVHRQPTQFSLTKHMAFPYTIAIICTIIFQLWPHASVAAFSIAPTTPQIQTRSYIIGLNPQATEEERTQLLLESNAILLQWIPALGLAEIRYDLLANQAENVSAASLPRNQSELDAAQAGMVSTLLENRAVEFVEENSVVHGTLSPDDPELQDTTNGYAQNLLQLEEAWNYSTGDSGIVIAVLDTGVDSTHPELSGQVIAGYDFINRNNSPMDDNGHGTHVAGIVAAKINNGLGSAGVCPGCRIMPVKVLDENNVGVWSIIVQGIVYAVDNGAQVINLSLGSAEESAAVHRAVEYAQSKNVLLVAAAGNSRSKKLFYPAAYSGVLSVAATDNEDREWSLSNRGTYIDVAAPGYLIYSTSITNEEYSYMTGTSMASPFVAGLAGLLLSEAPDSTPAELTDIIIQSTVDLGVPGWDSTFGFGRINAHSALTSLNGASQPTIPLRSPGTRPTQIFLPIIGQ